MIMNRVVKKNKYIVFEASVALCSVMGDRSNDEMTNLVFDC